MPNDKDTLEEIRQALLKAGYSQTWIDSVFPDKRSGPDLAREQLISWLEAGECSHADTLALYDQLQQSRAENEQLKAEMTLKVEAWRRDRDTWKDEAKRLRRELSLYEERRQTASIEVGKVLEENERLRVELADSKEHCSAFESLWTEAKRELEQLKAERDDYCKVLEWYGGYRFDDGQKARDILYRYEKGDSQNEQGML